MKQGRTTLYKGKTIKRGEQAKLRKKKGMSNAGKYKGVSGDKFCGPNGTFPVNTAKRSRNALARAHFAQNPDAVRACVKRKGVGVKEFRKK